MENEIKNFNENIKIKINTNIFWVELKNKLGHKETTNKINLI